MDTVKYVLLALALICLRIDCQLESVRIVFDGDSITDGDRFKGSTTHVNSLGQNFGFLVVGRLQAAFPDTDITAVNPAFPGHAVGDVLSRWSRGTLIHKPQVISLLVGINDVAQSLEKEFDCAAFEVKYEKLITEAQQAIPDVRMVLGEVFAWPNRTMTNDDWSRWPPKIEQANSVIAKLGKKYNYPVVPFYSVLMAAFNATKTWDEKDLWTQEYI